MKTALILGVAGQDGSYLAEHLLSLGYEVHGFVRPGNECVHVDPRVWLHLGDICDGESLVGTIYKVMPDEVYNVAAQSHAGRSTQVPARTAEINYVATLRLLETLRLFTKPIRLYQAVTAEILKPHSPQISWVDESSPLEARNPYGISKIACLEACRYYREQHGLFVACGLPFTHESLRRPESFLVRKVVASVARIYCGLQKVLTVGDLDASRDWGYAPDYVTAMHSMLALDDPTDFVLATNACHTVRDVIETAFAAVKFQHWEDHVVTDPSFVRTKDYKGIHGANSKAYATLNWFPQTGFETMIETMVKAEVGRFSGASPHAIYPAR